MSTTIPETIEDSPWPHFHSKRGEPTWEMAYQFPYQGEWSEEKYLELDVGRRVEFTDGVLDFISPPTPAHQRIVIFLLDRLNAYVAARDIGEVLMAPCPVRLRPGIYREPEVFFMRPPRITSPNLPPDGADLVMEVVSEGDEHRHRDLVEKPKDYAEAGIPEYWVVDPEEKKVIVFALDGNEYRTHGEFVSGQKATSPLLPGFEVAVADVFAAGEDPSSSKLNDAT